MSSSKSRWSFWNMHGKWIRVGTVSAMMLVAGCVKPPDVEPEPKLYCQEHGPIGWAEGDTEETKELVTKHDRKWHCICDDEPDPKWECPERD
jgi:hypothetical protein